MDQRRKYLEILRIEINDLSEDITALQDRYRGRGQKGEITDYVVMENVAVLEREIHGVATVRECLAHVRAEDYASLDEMLAAIRERLDERCGAFDPVVRRLVDRKLEKVTSYVRLIQAPFA